MVSNVMLTLLFLLAVAVVYYLTPVRLRWAALLAASLIFYISADAKMLLLVVGSAAWSFFAGAKVERAPTKESKKGWLLGGVLPLLGVLFLFKYFHFFRASIASLLGVEDSLGLSLVLPLGISYYTFKLISYVADIYQGKRSAEPHLGYYLTYVLFFPQILSGPIERSESFLSQLRGGLTFDSRLFEEGLSRILLGLFKKMVIANRLSGYVDTIFGAPGNYPALAAIMAAVFYSFQIYCDFSGYSDVAIGMGNLLSIRSRKNFDCPYFSRGIKEFWDRWHISLSSWLRDYVYIPLGGSRVSKGRKHFNVFVTFLVSGLWHGESLTFLVWGGLHGLWNMFGNKKGEEAGGFRKLWQTLVTFAGVTFTWIFFRAESLEAAFFYLKRMATGFSLSLESIQNSILPFTGDNTCAAYFLTVCFFLFLLFLYEWGQNYGRGAKRKGEGAFGSGFSLSTLWIALMGLSVLLFGVFGASGFLYAQF